VLFDDRFLKFVWVKHSAEDKLLEVGFSLFLLLCEGEHHVDHHKEGRLLKQVAEVVNQASGSFKVLLPLVRRHLPDLPVDDDTRLERKKVKHEQDGMHTEHLAIGEQLPAVLDFIVQAQQAVSPRQQKAPEVSKLCLLED
jgi:hypothetical protein